MSLWMHLLISYLLAMVVVAAVFVLFQPPAFVLYVTTLVAAVGASWLIANLLE